MTNLTVKCQPERNMRVEIDGTAMYNTPYTFNLANGSHVVGLLIPQPMDTWHPLTKIGSWIDVNGNVLSNEQQLIINLVSDTEVTAVLTEIYPMNPLLIVGILGAALALIFGIVHYSKKK